MAKRCSYDTASSEFSREMCIALHAVLLKAFNHDNAIIDVVYISACKRKTKKTMNMKFLSQNLNEYLISTPHKAQ